MKTFPFLLMLIACFVGTVSGQSRPTNSFHIETLTRDDTWLTDWKFRAGDQLTWAAPNFDDSNWKAFDPLQDVSTIDDAEIHWMRIKLSVGPALVGKVLALTFRQFVASEFYLDGVLIGRFGTLSPEVSGQMTTNSPLKFSLADGRPHVFAVRFAKPTGILCVRMNKRVLPVAAIQLSGYQEALSDKEQTLRAAVPQIAVWLIFAGVSAILTVIHLSVYGLTKNKAHLYYGLFNAVGFLECLSNYSILIGVGSPVIYTWLIPIAWSLQNTLFTLTFTVYALFGYTNKTAHRILLGISALAVLFLWIKNDVGFFLTTFIVPVVNLIETVRIGIWAGKRKLPGAWFVVIGVCLFFALLSTAQFNRSSDSYIFMALAQLSFPIGMAIFLAMQAALTNRTLGLKLAEIEILSEKTIEQEKDKQQLLANQNTALEEQVVLRTSELSTSLKVLQETQTQLIQSEKMASLGQLTAGIAHEIQNPLNFVNNFSEVSIELLDEMNEELDKGDTQEARALSEDIKDNLQKIGFHGRRADSIVKGMLQHSRSSGGKKDLVNINPLVEEHLTLAYAGLQAKDKIFKAELLTTLATDLPMLNLMAQDVGRALLNVFNNAFYAVQEKEAKANAAYLATIRVSTELSGNYVVISVQDNGVGIPADLKEKIMQPFFTTKPTGSGTGLGLSLTYEIIVKGHGGQILVDSIVGEGTTFNLMFPVELI